MQNTMRYSNASIPPPPRTYLVLAPYPPHLPYGRTLPFAFAQHLGSSATDGAHDEVFAPLIPGRPMSRRWISLQ
jgi:hypothetical protein